MLTDIDGQQPKDMTTRSSGANRAIKNSYKYQTRAAIDTSKPSAPITVPQEVSYDTGCKQSSENAVTYSSDELPFLQAALPAIAEVAEKPDQLSSVFTILDASHHSPLAFAARDKLLLNPEIAAMARERYWGRWPSIAQLSEMPNGSLGYCLAARLVSEGVGELPQPEGIDGLSDAHQYIQLRSRSSHDIWHQVLNLPTTLSGEVAIVAVAARQLRYPSSSLVIAAQLLSRSHLEDQEPDLAEAIAYGLRLGGVCAPLLAQRWEEGWERPLSDWRDALKITEVLKSSPFAAP